MKELIQALINQGIITAIDIQRMTTLELLLNIVERVNELHGLTKESLEAVQRLLDKGVKEEVIAQLDEWLQDGTIETLINQTALKNINDRVSALNELIVNDSFKMYTANLSRTEEHGTFNLFVFPKNFSILVDCGYTGQEEQISAFLDGKGITKLNVVIVTHFDNDHVGCFDFIARNYCDSNTLFFHSLMYDYSKLSGETIATKQQQDAFRNTLSDLGYTSNTRIPSQNETISLHDGMVKVRFLNTDESFALSYYTAQSETNQSNYAKSTGNNFSLICEISAFGKKVLMSGDVELQAQINNASFIEQCDILQVPHHNWNHSGYYKFFDNACPSIAFYNRNVELKDSFVYWSKYQRQCSGYIPTYYTFGEDVEMTISKQGIDVVSGYRDTTYYINSDQRQLIEYIPYYTDTTHNYWDYANWTIKDILTMIKEVPYTFSFVLFKSSRYSTLINEIKQMTGVDSDLYFMADTRTISVKRFYNWDGKVYHFGQYFDLSTPSSYTTNYYESRTGFTNNSTNENLQLSVGESKSLTNAIRNPEKLVVTIKSVRDGLTSVYTVRMYQEPNTTSRYLANDVNLSVDDDNRYLRIIKCNLTISNETVTLNECKLYVYNLLSNSLQEYACTLESIKGES